MAFKLIVLCAALAVANAGYLGAPAVGVAYSAAPAVSQVHYSSPLVSYGAPLAAAPAITSQSSNILRSFGNLGQVSTYSKTIDTPFSSVRKSDVRISNPGLQIASAPAFAYSAAPAVSQVHYSSPLVSYGAPLTAAGPAITSQSSNILRSFGNLGQVSTYSKTIDTPFSSVQKSDVRVSNPGIRYAAAPALSYASPALSYAAPAAHAVHAVPAAVGVAYSAAPAVSHFTYSGSQGLSYGW